MTALQSKLRSGSDVFRAASENMRAQLGELDARPGRSRETRRALAIGLAASLNAPIEDTRFGVFRM